MSVVCFDPTSHGPVGQCHNLSEEKLSVYCLFGPSMQWNCWFCVYVCLIEILVLFV